MKDEVMLYALALKVAHRKQHLHCTSFRGTRIRLKISRGCDDKYTKTLDLFWMNC